MPDYAGGIAATRAAAGAHCGGTTAQRSDRIRRSAGIDRHHGGDQSSVYPREAGEGAFGVQGASEVLKHGAECGAACAGFRGVDEKVKRCGLRCAGVRRCWRARHVSQVVSRRRVSATPGRGPRPAAAVLRRSLLRRGGSNSQYRRVGWAHSTNRPPEVRARSRFGTLVGNAAQHADAIFAGQPSERS
jgi:hypothetical protein